MTTEQVGESRDVGTLLHGERQVLEMIATGAPLAGVLNELCRAIDRRSGLMSAVFLVDADGTRLTQAAGPHLPDEWRRATASVPVTPARSGSCGAAVSRREQVVVPDVLTDPTFEPFREIARVAGVGAVWSTPFYARDRRVLGTFAVVSRAPGAPSELHLRLVERATHLASIAVERHLTEEALRESEERFAAAFRSSPNIVTISTLADGRFLDVNAEFVQMFEYGRDEAIGQTALGLGLYADPGRRPSVMQMLDGGTVHNIELQGRTRSARTLDLLVSMERIEIRGEVCLLTTASDITDRKIAQRRLDASVSQLRALANRLIHAQDDERRRIAQMLHETTAQDLAALKMLLARLNRTADRLNDGDRSALAESISLAEQSMTAIRTLSYLLHPPFLDEAGLLSALRWYAAGFAERSGIKVELDLPESLERLPLDTETALFRVVQESLINIHRHAESAIARIRLRRDPEALVLEIEDRGHGIPNASQDIMSRGGVAGVGIASMCERMEQLGGRLEIESSDHGTIVRVRLPIAKDAS
jgi:PAS domain S-box-containing protein